MRLMNEMFLVCTGTTGQLMNFKQEINEIYQSIILTIIFVNKKIYF